MVDPTPFLQQEIREIVEDPERLFGTDADQLLDTDVRFTAGSALEYVLIVRQQCRAGKAVLGRTCKHVASSFSVAKAGTDRQWEVRGPASGKNFDL